MARREWQESGGFDRYWLPQSKDEPKALEGRLKAMFHDDDLGSVIVVETPSGELVKAPGHRELVTKVREARSVSGDDCEVRLEFLGQVEGQSGFKYRVLHRKWTDPHLRERESDAFPPESELDTESDET